MSLVKIVMYAIMLLFGLGFLKLVTDRVLKGFEKKEKELDTQNE